jgi:transcriptional regulator with XRE-family HTH domain
MSTRKSGPPDAMMGDRIRMFRVNRGMSQTMLAGRIGVTFQQVRKCERGANRVGVSRLVRIAAELFESLRAESPRLNSPIALRAAVARLHAFDRGERRRLPFRR